MDHPENFRVLFQKYLDNQCSPEEADSVLSYLKNNHEDELAAKLMEEQIAKRLQENHTTTVQVKERLELRLQKILRQIETPVIPMQTGVRRFRWVRIAAAAILILGLGTGAWFLLNPMQVKQVAIQHSAKKDIAAPLSAHAVIRLAGGQQIILDSAANGNLATQGNVNIKKLDDSRISYTKAADAPSNQENSEASYNTLINPKGSKVISLILADGSQVWLNAGSSLKYPTAFTGNERKVEITGEAYFEVTHNVAMPFRVTKGDAEVTVLGTHFNVNAYDDEKEIKVTLLQGSLKVGLRPAQPDNAQPGKEKSVTIKPGEQAVAIDNGQLIIDKNADLDEVMAWKNGMFHFEGTNIEDIMRQVGRWYNVDIHYEVPTGNLNFSGIVSRKANVSELLKIMELTGLVHFKIKGNQIAVVK